MLINSILPSKWLYCLTFTIINCSLSYYFMHLTVLIHRFTIRLHLLDLLQQRQRLLNWLFWYIRFLIFELSGIWLLIFRCFFLLKWKLCCIVGDFLLLELVIIFCYGVFIYFLLIINWGIFDNLMLRILFLDILLIICINFTHFIAFIVLILLFFLLFRS